MDNLWAQKYALFVADPKTALNEWIFRRMVKDGRIIECPEGSGRESRTRWGTWNKVCDNENAF